jgi:hypothetical protein
MENQQINNENFKYIIENTILSVNSILEKWKINNNNENKISLFRICFSRFFNKKYTSEVYSIKESNPYCIIDDYKLISINLNISDEELKNNNIVMEFNKFIKDFDFLYFNEKNPVTYYR